MAACSADLVPVFSFGENDVSVLFFVARAVCAAADQPVGLQIYQQMPNEKGTIVYAFQKKFQSVFGFTLPLFHGRGILNCASPSPHPSRIIALSAPPGR